MLDTVKSRVNGLDLDALGEVVEAIQEDASQAKVSFDVTTRWTRPDPQRDDGRRLHHRRRAHCPQPQDRRRRAVRAARQPTARPIRRSC